MLVFHFLLFFVACVSAQVNTVKVYKCSHGVGLTPWASLWDSRLPNYPVACADGKAPLEIPGSAATEFALTIRSLGKVVKRQGVIVAFELQSSVAQLVAFCITDQRPTQQSTVTPNNAQPYVGNACGGFASSSTSGSPSFVASVDDGIGLLQGWAIRNPPPKDPTAFPTTYAPTVLPGTGLEIFTDLTLGVPTGGCNFYYSWNWGLPLSTWYTDAGVQTTLTIPLHITSPNWNSGFADSAGLDTYRGIQKGPSYAAATPCQWTSLINYPAIMDAFLNGLTSPPAPVAVPPGYIDPTEFSPEEVVGVSFDGSPQQQTYGGPQTVLVSYASTPIDNPMGSQADVTGLGNVMYANFFGGGGTSLIGFQLFCDAAPRNSRKYITISFYGRLQAKSLTPTGTPYLLNYPQVSTATNAAATFPDISQWDLNSAPNQMLGNFIINALCQNEATVTPTPVYPFQYNFPIAVGTANTATLQIEFCEYSCQDREFQEGLVAAVKGVCLETPNKGCSVEVKCIRSANCFEPISTTDLVPTTRRGLQQATRTSWLTTVLVSAYSVQTVQLVAGRVRGAPGGNLWPWISPFSAIRITWFNKQKTPSNVPFNTPSTAVPITSFPSAQAPWTGACYVYGPCRERPCAAQCNNGPVRKVSSYSAEELYCSCNACGGSTKLTAYVFTSFACATSKDQVTADSCCWNVMQDAVCWAVENPGVLAADVETIPSWTYRPPSIGTIIPNKPPRTDGPRDCPTSNSSSKGLLGLLGLLGLIPLLLCCCLLLLCLIRRKKREGDVHFATFDPNAAPVCATACPSIPACPVL